MQTRKLVIDELDCADIRDWLRARELIRKMLREIITG